MLFLIQWYVDTDTSQELELVGTANAGPWSVRAGGHLILLQDQDGYSESIYVLNFVVLKF